MQQVIKDIQTEKYEHLEEALRIYTFFKNQDFNLPVNFNFEDLHFCLHSKEPSYLAQYLLCFFFENYLLKQKIANPYVQLLLNKNVCIRQCLIYSQLLEIYQFLSIQNKLEEDTSDEFDTLEVEDKLKIFIKLINEIAPTSKWFGGILQTRLTLFEGDVNEKQQESSKNKWNQELQETLDQKDNLSKELKNIQNCKNLRISQKKKIKEMEKELEKHDEKAFKLTSLLSINVREVQEFGINQMKIIYRNSELCVWIIRSLPDYILIKFSKSKDSFLLYGQEIHEFIAGIGRCELHQVLMDYDFCKNNKTISPLDLMKQKWINNYKDFQLDGFSLRQYLHIGGKREYLIFCENNDRTNDIIIAMLLEIEEKLSYFFGKYQRAAWNYREEREEWRKQISVMSLFDFFEMVKCFKKQCFEFDSEEQIPEGYKLTPVPLCFFFKQLQQDLDEVNNCYYTYALIIYYRFLVQYSENIEKQQEKQRERDQSQNYIKTRRSVKIVDDDEIDLSDYYYK